MRAIFLTLLLIGALALVGVVSAEIENFQNGPGVFIYSSHVSKDAPIIYLDIAPTTTLGAYNDLYSLSIPTADARYRATNPNPILSNSVSWVVPGSYGDPGTWLALAVGAFDQDGVCIDAWTYNGEIDNGIYVTTNGATPEPSNIQFEVRRTDQHAYLYANGVLLHDLGVCARQPYYWAITSHGTVVDDVRVGGLGSQSVGVMPTTYRLAKDITDPQLSGMYDEASQNVYNTVMHASYSYYGDLSECTISIDGDHQVQSLVPLSYDFGYATSNPASLVHTSSRSGVVTFNLTQFFAEKNYGRHTVELVTPTGTAEAEFWYTGVATTETAITFDRDVYAPLDEVQINSTIGTSHWQPGMYSYYGALYDRTTGLFMGANWSITSQTQVHSTSVSTDLFPASGEYMTMLYAVDSQGNHILLDTDTCQVYADKVVFSGTVWDAQQGTILSGATVSLTQGGTTATQTTGSDGRFEFLGLSKDILTQLSAAKSGFTTSWSNTTPNEYMRYEVQIALAPSAPAHSGEAVFGTVRSYPLGSFVASPTVRILHDGTPVNSTTGTAKGFYIFDGLDASETYTIEVEADDYVNYSNAVVTGSGGASLTEMDPWLIPYYDLTVNLKDAVTLQTITALMAVSVGGQSEQTSTGTVTIHNVQMGAASVAVVGSGYTPNETAITMTGDQTITLYMTPQAVVPTTNIPLTPTPTPAIVDMGGTVYDGMTGGAITGAEVNVSVAQGSTNRYDTTDGSGVYEFANIQNDVLTTVNATATGYTHTAFSFTPVGSSEYIVDLYMYRTDESTNPTHPPIEGLAGAGGMVLGGPFHELVESPTVIVSNATWNETATGDANHVWYVTDLEPGQAYSFTASASGYVTRSVQATMGIHDTFTVVPIVLDGVYDVTVKIMDASSYALILQPVQLALSDGQSANTSVGSYTFLNLEYATYVVSAASEGYTGGGLSFLAYGDHTEYLYLSKAPSSASSQIDYSIPPKNVEILTRSIFGAPLAGVNVTVRGQSTTLPDPDILGAIFGWTEKYSDVDMANATMVGTTGTDGAVSFLMTDSVKYLVTFTDTTRGISETVELAPHDNQYLFVLGGGVATPAAGMPNMTLWATDTNSSAPVFHGYYSDPASATTALYFVVEQQNGTATMEVSNQSLGAVQTASPSFTVTHITGAQYAYGFRAVTTNHGAIQQWSGITLHSRMIDLGIEEGWYFWISCCFLFIFAGLFSGMTSRFGFILLPLFAGLLWYIGWLETSVATLGIAIIAGMLMYISKVQVG